MIDLLLNKDVQFDFGGALVTIKYRVPTAAEFEQIIDEKPKNTKVFSTFVTSCSSDDILSWKNGVDAEKVVETPGTYALVNETVKMIFEAATLSTEEKKDLHCCITSS